MNLKEYKDMWKKYFCTAVKNNNYIPDDVIIKDYYESYNAKSKESEIKLPYMPEPYLGDFSIAKIANINLNPGPVIEFQQWIHGDVYKLFSKKLDEGVENFYDEWAKEFIYMNFNDVNKLDKGMKFMKNRINYFEKVLEREVSKRDIVNMEVFAWHSDKFGKIENMGKIFKEFILEPIMDTDIEYVFLLRRPNIEAAKEAGVKLKEINCKWSSKTLKVEIGMHNNKIFIGTVNNVKGYPGKVEDIEIIKEEINKIK